MARAKAVYINITDQKVERTQEVLKGRVFADLDSRGRLVGFEFLEPLSIEIDGVKQ